MNGVIRLDDFRPKPPVPQPPASACDWRLIDQFCTDLYLCENVQGQVRAMLAGILLECLNDNAEAIAAWRTIEAEIKRPLREQAMGEAVYQPMLDRLRAVDALANDFWTHHAGGRTCPRYQPPSEAEGH
jgi:hypothetical protein